MHQTHSGSLKPTQPNRKFNHVFIPTSYSFYEDDTEWAIKKDNFIVLNLREFIVNHVLELGAMYKVFT